MTQEDMMGSADGRFNNFVYYYSISCAELKSICAFDTYGSKNLIIPNAIWPISIKNMTGRRFYG